MANVKELNINSTTYDIIGKGVVDNNNVSTPLKLWSGTKTQYDSIQTKDANTLYNITDDTIEIESLHNVGDIFYSMRAEDNLNGAVVCDGSSYAIADYNEGSQSVKTLLDSGKLPYVSISNFDAIVTAKGSCRCFGYDGSSATTFKVPKLNDVFVEAGTAATPSEFVDAGLPNISGNFEISDNVAVNESNAQKVTLVNGSFSNFSKTANTVVVSNPSIVQTTYNRGVNLDASRSSSIYGNSSTVQPKSVKYRAFIQLANGVSDSALQNVSTLMNIKNETADYVVEYQTPTSSNNYTWYRLYKSGWIEQGGMITQSGASSISVSISFLKTMSDSNYFISYSGRGSNNTSAGNYAGAQFTDESTTGVKIYIGNDNTSYTKLLWRVEGFADLS